MYVNMVRFGEKCSDLMVMGMEAFLAVSLSCCLAPPLITT